MNAPAPVGFQISTQRHRVLAATAQLLAREGYDGLTVEAIADAAGVAASVVLTDVGDRRACARESLLALIQQAHAAAAAAYQEQDCWPEGVREALRALLGFLAVEPDFVKGCAVELRYREPLVDQCLAAGREAFTIFLTPGHDADPTIPLMTAEVVSGGVLHLITRFAVDDILGDLPTTLPILTSFVLSAYLPPEEVAPIVARC